MAIPRILILGGGFAGLESAFCLHKALKGGADLTLLSDRDHFLFKPNTIYIPFGQDPETLKIPLAPACRRKNIQFLQKAVREIDPASRIVHGDGLKLAYDYLIVATGAGMRAEEIPGLKEYAQTVWTPEDMLNLRKALATLVEEAAKGRHRQVLFLIPPNNKCAGPLYEIVLMLETWLRKKGVRNAVDLTWTTYEETFIQAFGPRLHEVVSREFERRGIRGYPHHEVVRIEKDNAVYKNGRSLPFDLLISFPPYVASTFFPGLPSDTRGFLATDLASRRVRGHPEIFSAGDAGDFPVKQAFLALLQADAAAGFIADDVLKTSKAVPFEPTSLCVMEQFDKATFAQVPLRLTGRAEKPVEVRTEDAGLYRVGTSPLWRLGKKALGVYLPWRFRAGNPFHVGLPWKGMDLGLKVMSHLMAS